jgi:hypothetical protein
MSEFRRGVASAKTYNELEQVTHKATGPSDLMEFARLHMERFCAKNGDKRRLGVCVWCRESADHEADA